MILYEKAWIEAEEKTAKKVEERLRRRFADVYGEEEGNRRIDAMLERFKELYSDDEGSK